MAASLSELLAVPAVQLSRVSVTRMNLLCAAGLSPAAEPSIEQCEATVGAWAKRVQSETDRHWYRFRQNPAEFEHSEGYFRMLLMAVVLHEDFGVRYNPARMSTPGSLDPNDHFFADSRDVFLHGMLDARSVPDGNRGGQLSPPASGPPAINYQPSTINFRLGTCSSLPVLYVAVGRELGYPLKLVTTKGHLFVRWEGAGERFNIEATARGLSRFEDDYYRHWPFEVTPTEEAAEGYLKSLSPAEELAVFLSIRGMCLRDTGRLAEAAQAFAAAAHLAPACQGHKQMLATLQPVK